MLEMCKCKVSYQLLASFRHGLKSSKQPFITSRAADNRSNERKKWRMIEIFLKPSQPWRPSMVSFLAAVSKPPSYEPPNKLHGLL